jgi:hypothetical protein
MFNHIGMTDASILIQEIDHLMSKALVEAK